eukprot:COSAG02_NODE_6072_length_3822_cov_19.557511_5_plen_116_part_00
MNIGWAVAWGWLPMTLAGLVVKTIASAALNEMATDQIGKYKIAKASAGSKWRNAGHNHARLSMWWSRGASHNTCATVPGLHEVVTSLQLTLMHAVTSCLTRYFAARCAQLGWRLH